MLNIRFELHDEWQIAPPPHLLRPELLLALRKLSAEGRLAGGGGGLRVIRRLAQLSQRVALRFQRRGRQGGVAAQASCLLLGRLKLGLQRVNTTRRGAQ